MEEYYFYTEGLTVGYHGVPLIKNIKISLKKGEILTLIGPNGAGKTTILRSIIKQLKPIGGVVVLDGKETEQISGKELSRKLSVVLTERVRPEMMTCKEVVATGRYPYTGKFGVLSKEDWKLVDEAMELVHIHELADRDFSKTSDGQKQRVMLARAICQQPDIIILDEPTAVLTPQEIEELMKIMKNLAHEGKSILFITHKLNEIMEVADRCTILRKGKYIGTVDIADTTKEELSKMMVGRNVSFTVDKDEKEPGDTVLEVSHLTVASRSHENNAVRDVSFQVRRGEIVCIAGIDGNGQTELVQGLTGLEKVGKGTVKFMGQDITNATIRERSKHGMSHIPEDRHKHGLVLDYTLEQNLVLQRYWQPQFERAGFIKSGEVRRYAQKLIEQYDVRSGQGPVTIVRSMSGGNQQKAIIAREIDKDPELLVAVQPTRGLDVGAIEYIHKQLVAQRDKGKAVLLVSLELDEVMDVSDRILVMYEGEIVGELDPKKVTVEELGLYMAGAKRDKVAKEA